MLIQNARLLPELSSGYEGIYCIRVVDEKISEIAQDLVPQQEEVVVDAKGRTVLPGLIDMHVHFGVSGEDVLADDYKSCPTRAVEAYQFAMDTLKAGFTTVRDVGDVDYIAIAIRDLINAGKIEGPRMKCSGKILTPTESGNEYFTGMYDECDTLDEVRKTCRKQFAHGADFIKVMATGAISNPGGEPGMTIETEEEIREMVLAAKRRGTYVAAHCHGADAIRMCIRCGVKTIEHATFLPEDVLDELKKQNSYIVPTLVCSSRIAKTEAGYAEFMSKKMAGLIEKRDECLKKAYQAGLIIGFGTDEGTTDNWHGLNKDELVERYEHLDMKPIDILKQATVNSALIMGVDDEVGEIKVGKYGDFVIIDGKPEEDIYKMVTSLKMVIKGGKIISAEE